MARPQPQPTKSKRHKAADDQQVERLHRGYAQSMEITKVLADEQSKFQHIRIFDTVANGRVMTLDDIVQITSVSTVSTGSGPDSRGRAMSGGTKSTWPDHSGCSMVRARIGTGLAGGRGANRPNSSTSAEHRRATVAAQ